MDAKVPTVQLAPEDQNRNAHNFLGFGEYAAIRSKVQLSPLPALPSPRTLALRRPLAREASGRLVRATPIFPGWVASGCYSGAGMARGLVVCRLSPKGRDRLAWLRQRHA